MLSQDVLFAHKYPFSKTAGALVKKSNTDLSRLDEAVIKQALRFIVLANKGVKSLFEESREDDEAALQDIVAFPLAKIFLGILNDGLLAKKFCDAYTQGVFVNLEKEKDGPLFSLADELKIKAEKSKEPFFVKVRLPDFLALDFKEPFMKLINQKADQGFVFLDRADYCRLLAEKARQNFFSSIPKETKSLPAQLHAIAESVKGQLSSRQQKAFEEKLRKAGKPIPAGGVRPTLSFKELPQDPECFPPSIRQIYQDLLARRKLKHMENLVLAVFLANANFSYEQIIDLYRNLPNFKEHVSGYQIKNILNGKDGKPKYSAFSYDKMQQYGIACPELAEGARSPLSYYKRRLIAKYANKA